jgi:hypothetical protein
MEPQLELHKPIVSVYENGSLAYDYTPENGQITLETEFGKELVDIARNPSYTTFFDVGTWKGNGTTRCLAEGIAYRYQQTNERNVHLWSLESNIEIFKEAQFFWIQIPLSFLHLLYGCLHKDQLMKKEDILNHPLFPLVKSHYEDWYEQDKEDNKLAPCLDMTLFPELDVVVLDGGEFSSYGDWLVLQRKNPRVVCLDDVNVIKNNQIYKELKEDKHWELYKEGGERNGWAIFKKIE